MSFPRTIVKPEKYVLRLQHLGRYHSSQASGGKKLSPLPASPAQAKQRYLKSKEATDLYLDPQQKIMQMNRELEIVRNKHAAKLQTELEKSMYRRLVDPLVRHKHSLYNIMAMTIAYVLAHNLYVTSKKEKECRAELLRSDEENAKLQHKMDLLRRESTIRRIGSACALEIGREIKQENIFKESSWLTRRFASTKTLEESLLEDIVTNSLRKHLSARLGIEEIEEEYDKLSTEEIMQQNQQKMKEMNANPELLIQDALQQSASDQASRKGESRRVFSL